MSTMTEACVAVGLCGLVTIGAASGSGCSGFDATSASTSDAGPSAAAGVDGSMLPAVGGPPRGPDLDAAIDAATDGASEAAGPWTPASIHDLVLWLDGDNAVADVNGKVAAWNDKSGSNNNAIADDGQKPTLLTGANGFNTHQALHFDGSTTYFTIPERVSLRWTQSFALVVVLRHAPATVNNEGGSVFSKVAPGASNNGIEFYLGTALATGRPATIEIATGVGSFAAAPLSDDTRHRVKAAWNAATTTLSIQVDRSMPASVTKTITGIDQPGQDVHIGRNLNNQYVKADVAEIIAIAGATVDATDVMMLEAYLDKKYGL